MTFNFLKQQQYNISSHNRINPTDSLARVKYDMKWKTNDFNRMSVIRLEVAKSWYTIDSSIDFTLTLVEGGTGSYNGAVSISKTETGAMTGERFALRIQTALVACTAGYTCTYSDTTYKFTITSPAGVSAVLTTSSHILAKYMGIAEFGAVKGQSYSLAIGVAEAKILPAPINLQRYDELILCSNLSNQNSDGSLYTIYPHNTPFMGTIEVESEDIIANSVQLKTNLGVGEFILKSNDGDTINLNGQNWRSTLVCWKDSGNTY